MSCGIIAVRVQEKRCPNYSQQSENDKRKTPSAIRDKHGGERRGQRAAQSCAHKHDARHAPAVGSWKPSRKGTGCGGERAGFGCAKREARDNKHDRVCCSTRQGSKRGPTKDNARQHSPLSDPVAKPTGRNLDQAVGERENTKYVSHLDV
jgi:hypothetical protein